MKSYEGFLSFQIRNENIVEKIKNYSRIVYENPKSLNFEAIVGDHC